MSSTAGSGSGSLAGLARLDFLEDSVSRASAAVMGASSSSRPRPRRLDRRGARSGSSAEAASSSWLGFAGFRGFEGDRNSATGMSDSFTEVTNGSQDLAGASSVESAYCREPLPLSGPRRLPRFPSSGAVAGAGATSVRASPRLRKVAFGRSSASAGVRTLAGFDSLGMRPRLGGFSAWGGSAAGESCFFRNRALGAVATVGSTMGSTSAGGLFLLAIFCRSRLASALAFGADGRLGHTRPGPPSQIARCGRDRLLIRGSSAQRTWRLALLRIASREETWVRVWQICRHPRAF